MAVIVTNSTPQPIVVVPGETYIIDPSFDGTAKFEYGSGTVPVDFNVELNDSPSDPSKTVKIQAYSAELSPSLTIASNYGGPNTEIDFDKANDSEIIGGSDIDLKVITGSKDGEDTITFGDNVYVDDGVDTQGGDDTLIVGDNFSTAPTKTIDLGGTSTVEMNTFVAGDGLTTKSVLGGNGEDDITIGEDANIDSIDTKKGDDNLIIGEGLRDADGIGSVTINMGDGNDTIDLGNDADLKKLDMGDGDDVATVGSLVRDTISLDGGNGDNDCLFLDTSWLTPTERANFLQILADNEYIQDASGNWIADLTDIDGDGDTAKLTFTLDLLGPEGGKIQFKGWEAIKIVCFAGGTRIATPRGEVAVEELRPGDDVLTMDSGYQPIRWIGSSKVRGEGHLAPIRIKAGTYRNSRDIRVSPQHRILLKGTEVEMLFGENEALVAAKHLVDGKNVVIEEGGEVEYFHMLFDEHEIVFAEGLPSESFHPGAVGLSGMSHPARREIIELFPELEADAAAYGKSCRPSLKAHEAKVAARQMVAARAQDLAPAV